MRHVWTFLFLLLGPMAYGAPPALLHVQNFSLEQGHTYTWTAARPTITEGTIVVVEVSKADARVAQVGSAVLYVGATPAERANNGDQDGRIIAFVPGHVDLSATPIFWGPPTLPERVDAAAGRAALKANKVPALKTEVIQTATQPAVHLTNTAGLYRHLADLIDAHAPGDHAWAEGYRRAP